MLDKSKPSDELGLKDIGKFLMQNKKAYYMDGRPVEPDKLMLCQYCTNPVPFATNKPIDFAKHMVEVHPEHAKPKKTAKTKGNR